VAGQGYLAPLDHGGGSFFRCLYALALMFPPKASSHTRLSESPSRDTHSLEEARQVAPAGLYLWIHM
jgi:hypothetical protein